eukprot:Ihof_evm10s45 gene=Ihof_evmTU10s45
MADTPITKGPTILSHFTGLASLNQQERATAAVELLFELKQCQDKFQSESEDKALAKCEEITYCVKRLVRGLASSHHGARQGFALALTELLSAFGSVVPLDEVLEMLDNFMKASTNAKGQEERDNYFGKVFGYASILESGRLFEEDGDKATLTNVVERVLALADMKSYLKEPCYHVLVSRIPEMSQGTFTGHVLPAFEPLFKADDWSPEVLALALAIQSQYPDLDYKELFNQWKRPSLLNVKNFPKLQSIMLAASSVEQNHLHIAWTYMVKGLLGSSKPDIVHEFWSIVVDGGLFESSHERKYVGLQLLALFVEKLPGNEVGRLFTPKVLQMFINNASNEKTYLHKAAVYTLGKVKEFCQEDPEKAMVVLTLLLGPNGSRHFDRVTGTDTVQVLVSSLGGSHVQNYVDFLMDVFDHPGLTGLSEDKDTSADIIKHHEVQREWAIDQMLSLLRNRHVPKAEEWILRVLMFLLVNGMYSIAVGAKLVVKDAPLLAGILGRKPAEPSLSLATQKACSQKLFSGLGEVGNWASMGESPAKSDKEQVKGHSRMHEGTTQSGEFWVYHIYVANEKLLALAQNGKITKIQDVPEEAKEAVETLRETVEKCRKLESKHKTGDVMQTCSHAKAFELLCLNTALLLQNDPMEYIGCVDDLSQCFKKEFETKGSKTPKKKRKDDNEDEEPEAMEVLTDIILSMLSKSSALLRSVCEHVFRVYCPQLTSGALQLLLDVVKEEFKGTSSELMETVDDAEESDHDSEHDHSDKGESSEEEEEEDSAELEEMRKKVKEALGKQAAESGDESDEEEFDDEKMAVFDESLSRVFKDRKAHKSEKRDAQQAVLHFKMRTLDLLEIFLRKQPTNPLIMDLILPLLDAYKSVPTVKSYIVLKDRLYGIIVNKLCKLKECPHVPAIAVSFVNQTLDELFTAAYRATDKRILSVVSQCILLCLRVCIGGSGHEPSPLKTRAMRKRQAPEDAAHKDERSLGKLDLPHVQELYLNALTQCLSKRHSNISSTFFMETFKRYPVLALALVPQVTAACKTAVEPFAQTQAVALLECVYRAAVGDSVDQTVTLCQQTQPWIETLVRSFAKGENSKLKSKHVKAAVKTLLRILHLVNKRLNKKLSEALDITSQQEAYQLLMSATVAVAAPSVNVMCRDALRILDP